MAGEINKRLDLIKDVYNEKQIASEAYKHFKSITPVRSGNARRSTSLRGSEIQASYPYAQRLDQGYSSQAPDGMTKPTEEFIREYISKELRR